MSKINIIYHLSDIHVKKYNTSTEYEDVFRRVCKKIGKQTENALIVIAGDIFDSIITPSSMMLVKKFLCDLSEMCDIVIIRGNHDQINKTDETASDSLSATIYKLKTNKKHKIYLYDKSGTYIYKNIVFGVTDIFDKSIHQINPEDTDVKGKVKICLWHGTVSECIACNNSFMKSKITLKEFDNYDYVMLGHIHKMQYLNKKKTIAYSSSLIQQNYGETIDKHGFIKWDLKNKMSEFIEIKNDYGYITLKIDDNKKPKEITYPKNTRLRIIHKNCSSDFVKELQDDIKNKTNVIEIVEQVEYDDIKLLDNEHDSEQNEADGKNKQNSAINMEINDDEGATEQLMRYITKNNTKQTENDDEMRKIISDTIKEINYKYDNDKKNIKIKNLSFDNFNVYGKNNFIDYEKMNGVINISGRNHIGKSTATVYALLFSIYGKCSGDIATKKKDVHGSEYINNREREMTTRVLLNINGHDYEIHRTCGFEHQKRQLKHYYSTLKLFQDGNDISGKTQQDTNAKIENIVGTCGEMLSQCIIDQKHPSGFLYMNDVEKKEYICKIAKLDIYEQLQQKLESKHRYNSISITEKNKRLYQDKKKLIDNTTVIEKEINDLKEKQKQVQESVDKYDKKLEKITKQKIECDMQIQNNSIDKKELKNIKNIIDTKVEVETQLSTFDNKIKNIVKEIKNIKEELQNYNDIEKKNDKFEKDKKKRIDKIKKEIDKMREEYIKIDKESRNDNEIQEELDNVINEIKEHRTTIEECQQDVLKQDIEKYEHDKKQHKNYEKYVEIRNEVDDKQKRIDLIKNTINDNTKKVEQIMKTKKIDYENIKTIIADNEKKLTKLKNELKKYDNNQEIDKNEEFEKNKQETIRKLTKEKEDMIRTLGKIDFSIIGMSIDKINKENISEIEKNIKKQISKIEKMKKRINEEDYVEIGKLINKNETNSDTIQKLQKNITDYKELYEIIKNHKVDKKCKICMSNDITKYKRNIEKMLNDTEGTLNTLNDDYQQNQKQIKKMCKQTNIDYDHIKDIIQENMNLNKMINDIQQVDKQVKYNLEIEGNIEEINNKIKEEQNKVNIAYIKYQKKVDSIKNIADANQELINQIKEVDDIHIQNEKHNSEINRIEENKMELTNKMETFDDVKNRYDMYEKNKKIYADNENKIKHTEEKIKTLELKQGMIEKELDEYRKYEETLRRNNEIKKEIKKLEKRMKDETDKVNEEYQKYHELVEREKELNDKMTNIKLKKKNVEIKLIDINNKCKDYDELIKKQEEYDKIKENYDEIVEKYNNMKNIVQKNNGQREQINLRINGLETELNILNKLKEETRKIYNTNAMIEKIIHIIKNGYVDDVLSKYIIPKITNIVNTILTSYVPYRMKMEYKEKKIFVYKVDEHGMLSNSLKMSGYEEDMANIGFRLGLNQISQINTTNFFIIDEGFKQCDWINIKNVDGLFNRMRQIYDFILVITHNDDVKSYTDIDLPIEKKNGNSYINMKD